MGASVGLKFLQWFIRGVQFLSAALILGVYSYFLSTLRNHQIPTTRKVRAVEGIAGAAVLYALTCLFLLCCLTGISLVSFVVIVLDVAFIGAFIYVANANRNGVGSCRSYRDTPFGNGRLADTTDANNDRFTNLPSFHTACKLQTACLSVAIVAIFFFVFSILAEVALARHHRKNKRYGTSSHKSYTSGHGQGARGGLFSRLLGPRNKVSAGDENALPQHPTPQQGHDDRQSYATGTSGVHQDGSHSHAHNLVAGSETAMAEQGHGHQSSGVSYGQPNMNPQHNNSGHANNQPYQYDDGVYDVAATR